MKELLRFSVKLMEEVAVERNLVSVEAAGSCGVGITCIFKTGTYHFSTIPGHESFGVVKALSEGVHSGWPHKCVYGVQ